MWALTEEQTLICDSAQKLMTSSYGFEERAARLATDEPFSAALWSQFAELGWLGIALDEEDGGYGGGLAELALLAQVFGRHLVVEPFLPTVVLGGTLVARGAARTQRRAVLDGLLAGSTQLALAFAEPRSRYALHHVETRARADGIGGYRLSGAKSVVLNGASADYIVVSARTAGARDDTRGVTLFLVPGDTAGVRRTGYRLNDGHYAADVVLDDVELRAEQCLGEVDAGFELLESVIDEASVVACAEALGAMEAVMEMTTEYLNTREQFGRPIGRNQALKFRMVEMHYALEESRSMVTGAVLAFGGSPAARRAMVSATKVRVGNAARQIGQEGIQLHGAIGMTEDYAVGHYYKRLETLRMLFGDPDHHLPRYGRWSTARNAP